MIDYKLIKNVIGPINVKSKTIKKNRQRKKISISTYNTWKSKKKDESDYWKKNIMIYMVSHCDFLESKEFLSNLEIDERKNRAIIEIGIKDWIKITESNIEFYKYIIDIIENTPTELLKVRLKFLNTYYF